MKIVISGTVGVGKSTTAKLLRDYLISKEDKEVVLLKEDAAKSIYLDYYYKSPQEWAYISQMDFLFTRFREFLKDNSKEDHISIYDRHILDDFIFAELHTIKENIGNQVSILFFLNYKILLEKMIKLEAMPDLFILLKGDLDLIIKRIKKRGRKEEININKNYWEELYEMYYERPSSLNHFKSYSKRFVLINVEEDDTPNDILDKIKEII